jgi:hypothetical protein
MKKLKNIAMKNSNLFISILCSSFAFAQVGINTTSPQGVLDVTSANSAVVLTRNANPPANVTAPTAGMVIYDSSNKTLRYYNGTQWSTVISSQTLTTANEGVVKLNSGAGVKPSFAFRSSGGVPLMTYQNIVYQTPMNIVTDFASSPTTTWPENIINPVPGDIYDSATNRFLENPIAGQVHMWRVIVSYANKNNGSSLRNGKPFKSCSAFNIFNRSDRCCS